MTTSGARTAISNALAAIALLWVMTACSRSVKVAVGDDTVAGASDGASPETNALGSAQGDVVPIMHAKLGYTHALLDAVAMRDFFQVEANAMALVDLSNESDWQVHDTVYYRIFSERFREAAEDVAMQARGNDIDAVSRAYVRLTMSCVDCHSYLRKENLTKDMPVRVTMWN
jgi:hypothetical protein